MKKLKVLMVAGGTGGHIFPALAIANELKARGAEIEWLGTANRMEAKLVPQYGYPINFIDIEGVVSCGAIAYLKAPFKVLRATGATLKILDRFKPNVVMCLGGYVCGPAGLATKYRKIPLVIHEQNAVMGLTNKLLSRIATKTLAAFPISEQHIDQVVGQPLRKNFTDLDPTTNLAPLLEKAKIEYKLLVEFIRERYHTLEHYYFKRHVNSCIIDPDYYSYESFKLLLQQLPADERIAFQQQVYQKLPLKVLAIGGSLGAKALNESLLPAVDQLVKQGYNLTAFQQVGAGNSTIIQAQTQALELNDYYQCADFIDDMITYYQNCDLVICRSGAITVFEVAKNNRYAIFIPYPGQKDQQQLKNTQELTKIKACSVIPQSELTPSYLAEQIIALTYNELYHRASKMTKFASHNATVEIATLVTELTQ